MIRKLNKNLHLAEASSVNQKHIKLLGFQFFDLKDGICFYCCCRNSSRELLKEVWELKKKGDMFETVLESMEVTLTAVSQALEKIKGLNKELDRENDKEIWKLWKQLEKGKKLVNKYKQAKCSSCLKKPFYMKDLEKLDDSLKRFCKIVMPVLQSWIQMETLLVLEDNREELIETQEDLKDIQEEIQQIHEEVEDNLVAVIGIHKGVRDIHEDVKQVKKNSSESERYPDQRGRHK